jgi:hypothetical protein
MQVSPAGPYLKRLFQIVAGSLVALAWAPPALAQQVGEIIFVQGIASAQRGTETPRFITKGDALNQGDVITTSPSGYAVIGLKDGTKVTLRPDTVFAVDKYNDAAGQESGLFRILKGGVRTITGLVAQRRPQSVQFSTTTATIGIRGTSFDARLCGSDCAQESAAIAQRSTSLDIVARVAAFSGTAVIVGVDGSTRAVVLRMPLVNGESVRTEKGAHVVLAFRDESKITVIGESEFKLENVRLTGPQADSGSFVVRVVRGGARALTGLLAKREPGAVRFNALTATIGIRGTGHDTRLALDCVNGACSQGVFVHTWEGEVGLEAAQQTLPVGVGRAGVFNPEHKRLTLLDQIPQFFLDETAPRPDGVAVDFAALFAQTDADPVPPGFYVSLREGRVEFRGPGGAIDLGPGESGALPDGQDTPVRLARTPLFISEDIYPAPEKFDEQNVRTLDILNPGGSPGDVICEL